MKRAFTDAELEVMAKDVHELAVAKGFWEKRNLSDLTEPLLLIVGELSEAHEASRDKLMKPDGIYFATMEECWTPWSLLGAYQKEEPELYVGPKPEGFPTEAADAYLRILDLLGALGASPEPLELSSEPEPKMPISKHLWRLTKFVHGAGDPGPMEEKVRWLSLSLGAIELMCVDVGADLRGAVMLKHDYNRGREYLHGKRF